MEISTATALLLLFLNAPDTSFPTVLNASIVLLFVLIVFFDIRYFIIPDKILIAAAIPTTAIMLTSPNAVLPNLLISGLGLATFFAILFIVSRGKWIGFGDVKLILIMGLLLGYPLGFFAVMSSIWAAAIFSILLLVTGRANLKTQIPFGSFLAITTIIFVIFNHELQEISRYFY
ncbi:MAG: hypothetical protein A2651_03185 [Candidatus Yanofskybacteria bacterium RIFCSPHIGHO2_01_FULL_42_12]|nr:MAG: hypothetical protein A2651_03185 [Candidatus Yanofskybacteria bacterium RIFCSPHIGHO2_01_FULL_42_12]